jgi:hypothetical protein
MDADNQPSRPRPTSGSYPAPPGATPPAPDQWGETHPIDNHVIAHSAFDELGSWDAGFESSLGDGAHESTLD